MSLPIDGLGFCSSILVGLDEVVQANDPQFKPTPVGLIEGLHSPANYVPSEVTSGGSRTGGRRVVRVWYRDRTPGGTDLQVGKNCDPVAEVARQETYVEITDNDRLYRKRTLSEDTIRHYCDAAFDVVNVGGTQSLSGGGLRVYREMLALAFQMRNELLADLNAKAWEDLVTVIGSAPDGSPLPINLPFRAKGGEFPGHVIEEGLQAMLDVFADSDMYGRPIAVGTGNLASVMRTLGYGGQQAGGFNAAILNQNIPFDFYNDRSPVTKLGDANNFVAWAPQVLQHVTYNDYVGNFATPIGGDVVFRGTMTDPFINELMYDIRLIANGCDETFTLEMALYTKLFAAPTIIGIGDNTTNGIFQFVADDYFVY